MNSQFPASSVKRPVSWLGCHWVHDPESGYPGKIGEIMRDEFKIMNESGGGDQRIAQFQGSLLSQSNSLVEHRTGDRNQIRFLEEPQRN